MYRAWLDWGPAGWLLVNCLATYRLARLVSRDTILAGFRRWFSERYEGILLNLIVCPWCLSVWFAAGTIPLTVWTSMAWSVVATFLAMSAVAGLLSELA